jgi:murein DD-endopeptidase MepM/ murein hydrolase activator NlpD
MPSERARRSDKTDQFDIVVIPAGQGGSSRSYRFSKFRMWLMGSVALLVVILVVLAGLIFTPLALVVPIPNSVLEEKYGHQLLATQKQLQALGQEVIRLGEYNRQLRKVLGDPGEGEGNAAGVVDTVVPDTEAVSEDVPADLSLVPLEEEFSGEADEPRRVEYVQFSAPEHHGTLPFVGPVAGIVTQRFDSDRRHYGMDYAGKSGTPVFAAADGYVVFAGWTPADGNMVMISHGAGMMTVYKHNQSLLTPAHVTVKRGDTISLLGSSGMSTGPHLHFEIWKDGTPVDPEDYLLGGSRS